VIVGDGPLMEEMTGLAKRLGLIAEIDFLGFRSNSLSILRQMDCLLLTSDHEGLPMVVLEALALGVPTVAHSVGGLPEVLEGIAGNRLVTDHTPGGYARAIQELTGPESRGCERRCGPPARFEMSATAQAYAALYHELLGRPPVRY